MSRKEEETYSIMFRSLKHPARRRILRMLAEKPMTFSQLLEALGTSSPHLTYHLESLGELLSKTPDGKYRLSSFGEAAVATMKNVEEAPALRRVSFTRLPLSVKMLVAVLAAVSLLLAAAAAWQYTTLNRLSLDYDRLKVENARLDAANQQLLSWTAGADKAVAFLRDVVQVDLQKYRATLLSDTLEYRADLGGVQEEILKYSLTSNESKVDVVLRFRNATFSRYQLFILEETPAYAQPQLTNAIDAAEKILERYEAYTGAPYVEPMRNLLAEANHTVPTETAAGNVKLKASASGSTIEVQLMYTVNGIDFSAKSVRLIFENGVLKELSDGWSLLKVGSTTVNISREKAIEIAREHAKNFTWNANGTVVTSVTVLDTPVDAAFIPHPREEPLALIPYWYVTLYLDKVYPGNVNRIAIGIWADTGEVANIQTLST